MGFFDELCELGKEFTTIITEGAAEFGEIMTDGFYEMVIKDNNNYKTSYEIRDEAEQVASKANRRYSSKQIEIKSAFNKVEQEWERIKALRIEVIHKVQYKLNSKGYEVSVNNVRLRNRYTPEISNRWLFDFTSKVPIPFGKSIRREMAKEYLEDARDYKVEIDKAIADYDRCLTLLTSVSYKMQQEDELLRNLLDMLERCSSRYYGQILSILISVLKVDVLDKNGHINNKYEEYIYQLRRACQDI